MKRCLCLLLAVCAITSYAYAQKVSGNPDDRSYAALQKKYTIAIQPLQWFNWGWRFDFEMRLGDGPGWLQVGPEIYGVTKSDDYYYDSMNHYETNGYSGLCEPFSKLRGAGLDINYKRFVNPMRSIYVAGGLSYAYFDIGYYGGSWRDYTEDGLPYHEYIRGYRNQYINRGAINAYVGYQVPSSWAFLFDMFVGVAYRQAFSDKSKYAFDEYMLSYGYTGVVFLTGVRFGIGFKSK